MNVLDVQDLSSCYLWFFHFLNVYLYLMRKRPSARVEMYLPPARPRRELDWSRDRTVSARGTCSLTLRPEIVNSSLLLLLLHSSSVTSDSNVQSTQQK